MASLVRCKILTNRRGITIVEEDSATDATAAIYGENTSNDLSAGPNSALAAGNDDNSNSDVSGSHGVSADDTSSDNSNCNSDGNEHVSGPTKAAPPDILSDEVPARNSNIAPAAPSNAVANIDPLLLSNVGHGTIDYQKLQSFGNILPSSYQTHDQVIEFGGHTVHCKVPFAGKFLTNQEMNKNAYAVIEAIVGSVPDFLEQAKRVLQDPISLYTAPATGNENHTEQLSTTSIQLADVPSTTESALPANADSDTHILTKTTATAKKKSHLSLAAANSNVNAPTRRSSRSTDKVEAENKVCRPPSGLWVEDALNFIRESFSNIPPCTRERIISAFEAFEKSLGYVNSKVYLILIVPEIYTNYYSSSQLNIDFHPPIVPNPWKRG